MNINIFTLLIFLSRQFVLKCKTLRAQAICYFFREIYLIRFISWSMTPNQHWKMSTKSSMRVLSISSLPASRWSQIIFDLKKIVKARCLFELGHFEKSLLLWTKANKLRKNTKEATNITTSPLTCGSIGHPSYRAGAEDDPDVSEVRPRG